MKLWRVEFQDEDGVLWNWHPSKQEAYRDALRVTRNGAERVHVGPVDFPSRKADLIRWLNAWSSKP